MAAEIIPMKRAACVKRRVCLNIQRIVALEPPQQLVAFELRGHLEGGRTRPFLAAAHDQGGREYAVALKLKHPEGQMGAAHFGATSLACELICAVIARAVGLGVPDYAIVDVPSELVEALLNPEDRELVSGNIGLNFGTVFEPGCMLWNMATGFRSEALREVLESVLSFDATVINGDRKATKPNLLIRGENVFLIDHSLALPMSLWNPETVAESPLLPTSEIEQHCTFSALAGRGSSFTSLHQAWSEAIAMTDFERLRSWIPEEWEQRSGDLDKIFSFLSKRSERFSAIAVGLREVVQ